MREQRVERSDENSPDKTSRQLAWDERAGIVGELMYVGNWCDPSRVEGAVRRVAFLRPLGGGREWQADPAEITLLDALACEYAVTVEW